MLNNEFDKYATNKIVNLFPKVHEAELNELEKIISYNINNGVYQTGLA